MFENYLMSKHRGVVGFEYVIILIIMAVALFTVFNGLQKTLTNKGKQIGDFIDNNGQNPLATGGPSGN